MEINFNSLNNFLQGDENRWSVDPDTKLPLWDDSNVGLVLNIYYNEIGGYTQYKQIHPMSLVYFRYASTEDTMLTDRNGTLTPSSINEMFNYNSEYINRYSIDTTISIDFDNNSYIYIGNSNSIRQNGDTIGTYIQDHSNLFYNSWHIGFIDLRYKLHYMEGNSPNSIDLEDVMQIRQLCNDPLRNDTVKTFNNNSIHIKHTDDNYYGLESWLWNTEWNNYQPFTNHPLLQYSSENDDFKPWYMTTTWNSNYEKIDKFTYLEIYPSAYQMLYNENDIGVFSNNYTNFVEIKTENEADWNGLYVRHAL